jgi:HAD superfamily hydrolase (TIGR01509 family)
VTARHLIFDCDGVLVDSEPLSMRIDVEILAENGVIMSEAEAHARFVGKTFAAMLDEISKEFGAGFPSDASAQKDLRLLALYERDLKAVEGVRQALETIGHHRYSVASNSPAERVAAALRITGLTAFFGNRITTFEEVPRPKPEPDVFIEAARRAGYRPEHCIVIEDSVTGVTAAHRARCRVMGFTGTHPQPLSHALKLQEAGAALIFHHMAELPSLVEGILHDA